MWADMTMGEEALREAADGVTIELGETQAPDPGFLGTFGFSYGQEVLLHGLSDATLNGRRAIVLPKAHGDTASAAWDKGRVPVAYRPSGGVATSVMFSGVQTLLGDRILSIKPANLGRYGLKNVPGAPYQLGEELYWECAKGTVLNADDECSASVVRELIGRGADVQWEHPTNGATVLNNACMGLDTEVVRLLLEAGADPNAPEDSGGSIFYCLNRPGAPAKIKLLLDHGAKPNEPMQMSPLTCLTMARNMSRSNKSSASTKAEMIEVVAILEASMVA